jgi:hypothetical protein
MATRAERFRAASERSGKARPAAVAKRARPGSPSRGRKATYQLEETPPSVPASRKSSRRSKNRIKAAVQLKGTQELKLISPRSRHDQK